MSALQKVIRETQTQQLSAQDIERVIEEQVSKRLAGMAIKADIQNAGAQMQIALSQVPVGLSGEQVQQAVNRELNDVMQDVAKRVNHRRRIAGQGQQDPQSWQRLQDHVQTEFVIEELPNENTVVQPHGVADTAIPQRALLSAGHQGTVRTTALGAMQHGKNHPATTPNEPQLMTSQRPTAADQSPDGSQYAAIEAGPSRGSNQASLQIYTPTSTTLENTRHGVAMEALPMSPMVPGNALAPINRSGPSTSGNAGMPYVSGQQQYDTAQVQSQLAAQTAPTPEWGVSHPRPMDAARPQRQLEAAPDSSLGLEIAVPRSGHSSHGTTMQAATQAQQIAGLAPQRQLEAPPSSSTGYPITGQELVYQSRDLERQPPRR
jgi:hypothetical protein